MRVPAIVADVSDLSRYVCLLKTGVTLSMIDASSIIRIRNALSQQPIKIPVLVLLIHRVNNLASYRYFN